MSQPGSGSISGNASRVPLIALVVGAGISAIGNILTLVAVPWFVLVTTGSATKTGVTAFFTALPAILAAFLGGAIVDRVGYKRTSVIADLASGITVALIPLLHHTIGLEFWQLLALVFLGAFLDAPGTTARQALVPEVARLGHVPLERAASIADGIQRTATLVGAPLAGVLIAWIGPSNVLWVDALTFGCSAAAIAVAIPASLRVTTQRSRQQYLRDLQAGIRFMKDNRLIRAIVFTVMVTNMIDAAMFSVVFPVFVREVFGSAVYLGVISAVAGGTALTGTILYGAVGHQLPRRPIFTAGFLLSGIHFWVYAVVPSLWVILLARAVGGLAVGPLNPIMSTVEYEQVPASMRGRVFGMTTAGLLVATPVGVLLAGYLLDWIGIQPTLVVLGSCYLVATLTLVFNPTIREMDTPADGVQ